MSNLDIKFQRLSPFKRCVLQNFPFIEADFDALTNYGLLCKVVDYLNKVIDSQNEVQGVTEEIVTAFNNLYDYVKNYFDNLDVQDEINNKLDQMVEDGTLQDILQEVLGIYDSYNFHTVMATKYYRSNEPEYGMQGGCVLPDGTIFQCTGNNKGTGETGKLLHYAQDGTLLNSAIVNYGHCNGCTYNSKTGKVIITSTQDDVIGKYMIFEVDPTTLTQTASYDLSSNGFPDEPYGIVYVEEDDTYVFCNYWYLDRDKYLWKTKADYTLIESKFVLLRISDALVIILVSTRLTLTM